MEPSGRTGIPNGEGALAGRGAPGLTSTDWAGEASTRWSAHADRLEAMIAPVDDALIPIAGLERDAAVLDVGCGRGVTTRAAAVAVGARARVTGIDISAALIAEAAAVPVPPNSAPITWVAADAATHALPPAAHDRVISRFGTIFFDDPVAAFANLRRTTRPGGRLAVAVWQPRDASEFQTLAVDVAVRVAAQHGYELSPDPPDAGPFAYGLPEYVTPLLEQAGWVDVEFEPHDLELHVGGAGTTSEEAVEMGRGFGPLARLLEGTPPEIVDAVTAALVDEMEAHWDGTGVALGAAIATITARPAEARKNSSPHR